MQNFTKTLILFGCAGLGLIGILAVCTILWMFFSAAQSVNNYLTGGYKVVNGKVYFYQEASGLSPWRSWEIPEADAATLETLKYNYAKDKNHGYVNGYLIPQSEGKTFQALQWNYSADQNHVFNDQRIISNSPEKFRLYQGIYAADDKKVFFGGKEFLPGTVDAATFEQVGSSDFFRDKNHVYMNADIVKEADPATFQPIPDRLNDGSSHDFYHAKDKTSVFYQGVKVAGCDPQTHQVINFEIHRDAQHVYLRGEKISDDPEHFQQLNADYYKDGKNVYWKTAKISADPATFQVLTNSSFGSGLAKDAKNVYWCDLTVERADAATFVVLNDSSYGKDKNNVWYAQYTGEQPFIVESADLATFEPIAGGYDQARDKNNNFGAGKIMTPRTDK